MISAVTYDYTARDLHIAWMAHIYSGVHAAYQGVLFL